MSTKEFAENSPVDEAARAIIQKMFQDNTDHIEWHWEVKDSTDGSTKHTVVLEVVLKTIDGVSPKGDTA